MEKIVPADIGVFVETILEAGHIATSHEGQVVKIPVHGMLYDGDLYGDEAFQDLERVFFIHVVNGQQVEIISAQEVWDHRLNGGPIPEMHFFRSDVVLYSGCWTDACYPRHVGHPKRYSTAPNMGQQMDRIVADNANPSTV